MSKKVKRELNDFIQSKIFVIYPSKGIYYWKLNQGLYPDVSNDSILEGSRINLPVSNYRLQGDKAPLRRDYRDELRGTGTAWDLEDYLETMLVP